MTGQICSTIAAAMGGKVTSPAVFVPFYQAPEDEQTAEEQQEIMARKLRPLAQSEAFDE